MSAACGAAGGRCSRTGTSIHHGKQHGGKITSAGRRTASLSRGSLARKLGARYPDRFTEDKFRTLAAFLEITADQRERLRRFCGLGEPDSQGQPPAEAASSQLVALPAPLTSFVGRDAERREVTRLLATTRLLTLAGAGGIGKTRLALQDATDVTHTYVGGVLSVELLSARSGSIAQAIATATTVREEPGRPLPESIAQRLHPRRALLLLDNCEHLPTECALVSDACCAPPRCSPS